MPEDFQDSDQEQLDWKKYWAIGHRRVWNFLVPMFLGWAMVWGASWLMPSVYRSGTLILVEHRLDKVVPTGMTEDLQSRLDSITQQVLSRTRLLSIINNLNLYAGERSRGKSDDELVEQMRKNIDIELVRSADRELSSFNIFFSARTPEVAQQVTTELTNVLITENLEITQKGLDDQTKFLDSQLAAARQSLTAQEERVREFKDRHLGELPGQLQSNIQILTGLQGQLQAEQDALGRARQQNTYLETLISQYNTMTRTVKAGDTSPGGLPALDAELQRLRGQLADLSSHYTDQHPDVRKVREQIAKTERMKQQLEAELKNAPPADSPDAAGGSYPGSAPLMEVRSQLKANQLEISNRQRSVNDLQARIDDYRSRLNRTPVREQELADLTRDYDQSRANYEQLLAKKNQAELESNYSKQQQGEHFRMIDPPSLPVRPFSPNRIKLGLLGLFAGIVVGVVAAGTAEFLDDRIHDEEAFKQVLPAEILVEIPPLPTVEEQQRHKRRVQLGWLGAVAMVTVMMAGVVFSVLRG